MSYEELGFLGDDTSEIRELTRKAFPHVFAKCEDVNRLAYQVRNSIKLNYDSELHIVLICLLQKIIDSFQSVIMLMEVGLESDSNIIIRSSLEAMFILRKLSEDENFLIKYLGTDQLHLKKILNASKNDPQSALRRAINAEAIEHKLSEIMEDISEFNFNEIKYEQLARDVKLNDWYQLPYRILSSDAHSLPGSLVKYIRFDKDLNVITFDFNPKTDNTKAILITHCGILLIALDSVEKIFHTGFENDIDKLFQSI